MTKHIFFAASALLVSASAMAQAGPVAQKSSDQIVCELTGDCGQNADAQATEDKPDSRGFNIAKRGVAQSSSTTVTRTTSRTAATRNPAVVQTRQPVGGSSAARFSVAPRNVGRADLSVVFVTGSSTLTDSGRQQAQAFAQALRSPQLSGKRFMIAGHTDSVGSRALNLDLSKRRAQSMIDFLVEQGASRSQFEAKGYGFDRPLSGMSSRSSANRRVEVVKLN
jgi:OmpA-OmpF porin, OOP family